MKGSPAPLLEGNGAGFVRERALAGAVQRALHRLYQLEGTSDVADFVEVAEDGEREALFVRHSDDGALEMSVRVPKLLRREFEVGEGGGGDLDPLCQIIEGVSHFVYLAERAPHGRDTTQLELELQAEVDKYVVLAGSIAEFDVRRSATLRTRLYERVTFEHAEGTDLGQRYRVANDVAQRFVRRLEREFVATRRYPELREELRRFYWMGQEDKLRIARAA